MTRGALTSSFVVGACESTALVLARSDAPRQAVGPMTAADLARIAGTIVDAEMRVAWVRNELRGMDGESAAELISAVAAFAEARTPPFADLLLAITVAL